MGLPGFESQLRDLPALPLEPDFQSRVLTGATLRSNDGCEDEEKRSLIQYWQNTASPLNNSQTLHSL